MQNSIFFMLPAPVGEAVAYSIFLGVACKFLAVQKKADLLLWGTVMALASVPAAIYFGARMG
jgi:hypothetical protein